MICRRDPAETKTDGVVVRVKLEAVAPTTLEVEPREQVMAALVMMISAEFELYIVAELPG